MKQESWILLVIAVALMIGFAGGYWIGSTNVDTATFDFETVRCFNVSDSIDGMPKWRTVCIDGLDNYVLTRLEKLIGV